MSEKQAFWVHPTSYTYTTEEPERLLETIWVERPGWGYLKARDLWIRRECTLEELLEEGYVERKPVWDGTVTVCRQCGMYISGIPGLLVERHLAECAGGAEDFTKLEENLISQQRILQHQKKILEEIRRAKEEQEEAERRERFDKIRDEALLRQQQKDRKKRLKEETRNQLKKQ